MLLPRLQQQCCSLEAIRQSPLKHQQARPALPNVVAAASKQQFGMVNSTSAAAGRQPKRSHPRQQQSQQQAEATIEQPPSPPSPQQQQQQQQQPVYWGYLTGGDNDQWTWDDDYNQAALAKAAAAAQQVPPTPRQQQLAARAAAAAQQRPTVITRLPEQFSSQVLSNGLVLIDKPARWSSADVVRQLQTALKVTKMGHAGPLDSHATGLLIVLLGAATRLTPKFEPLERIYTGTLQLGVSTTTHDATGQVLQVSPWQEVTDQDIAAAAAQFQGEIQQLPAMWSSTKYKNRPLWWYAQRGEEVVRQPKAVHVTELELWREPGGVAAAAAAVGGRSLAGRDAAGAAMRSHKSSSTTSSSTSSSSTGTSSSSSTGSVQVTAGSGAPSHGAVAAGAAADVDLQQHAAPGVGVSDIVHFRVVASKGTSIRVLVDDIGRALGCGAHVVSLRRESIGGFSVETAWSLEVLLPLAKKYAKGFKRTQAAQY